MDLSSAGKDKIESIKRLLMDACGRITDTEFIELRDKGDLQAAVDRLEVISARQADAQFMASALSAKDPSGMDAVLASVAVAGIKGMLSIND